MRRAGPPFAPVFGVNGRNSLRIGQPDGPWLRTPWNDRQMGFRAGHANERQLLAIGRPSWSKVTVDTGRDVTHALRGSIRRQINDRDKRMVSAPRAESNMLPIR